MDKTININIAGTLFQIDDEAYRILRDYLQAVNNRFRNVQGGHETIEDIESRIAEILMSQNGLAGTVSKLNVESMISIIGKPEDFGGNESETEAPVYTTTKKRMYRNPDDSIISGVCGGIGAYLNTDPVLFRILFAASAFFAGAGIFIYIVLWIALPPANSDAKKRELFGNAHSSASQNNRQPGETTSTGSAVYNKGNYNTSTISNAINEIFKAVGRVLFIALRIFLIIIGGVFVLSGFLLILSFVMVFVFKYGGFSSNGAAFEIYNFPDFLNYIVPHTVAPWIILLSVIVLILPLFAMIYWGVKMIFWFKAKDGIISLAGLVLWILAIAALAIILTDEATHFAASSGTTTRNIIPNPPDTLYVIADHKVADLQFDKKFSLPDNEYSAYINKSKKELYILPFINVTNSDSAGSRIELNKHSSALTKSEAVVKSEELIYNYSLKGDTLLLDEYFTIPSERKWSGDGVVISLYLPLGTILKFDSSAENILRSKVSYNEDEANPDSDSKIWILTEEGIKHPEKKR
jgi:phage shock protein PspC (stress-responsive transcriptional regulator)